jgi:hypothetical protein
MWMKLLLAAGCRGSSTYSQSFDVTGRVNRFNRPSDWVGDIAWFRSVPHRNQWCCPSAMAADVRHFGWSPFFVLLVRDPAAVLGSQSRRKWRHGSVEYQFAWAAERVFASGFPWRLAVYESLMGGGLPVANRLLVDIGLEPLDSLPFDLRDGNAKHFASDGDDC